MDFIARIGGSRKGGGSWPTGFIVWRVYDAQNLSSDDALMEVECAGGRHVTTTLNLSCYAQVKYN